MHHFFSSRVSPHSPHPPSASLRIRPGHTVKKCIWQCLILAIPGVLIGTVLTGGFAKLILSDTWGTALVAKDGSGLGPSYGWAWPECFMFGAILSATDPVAVVGLLKEVGAAQALTMQIAGESMFNDGVAIVLYNAFLAWSLRVEWTFNWVNNATKAASHDAVTSDHHGRMLSGAGASLLPGMVNCGISKSVTLTNWFSDYGVHPTNNSYDEMTGDCVNWGVPEFLPYLGVLFCKMFFGGLLVGYLFGMVTLKIIDLADSESQHVDSTIQVAMTFVCGYVSFIFSEYVCAEHYTGYQDGLGFSGVVAAVVSGIMLASSMWPHVVDGDSMRHVWHTVEFFANTLLFLLAGLVHGEQLLMALRHPEFAEYTSALSFTRLTTNDRIANCTGAKANVPTTGNGSNPCISPMGMLDCNLRNPLQYDLMSCALTPSDIPWSFITFIACLVIRFVVLLICFPFLKWFSGTKVLCIPSYVTCCGRRGVDRGDLSDDQFEANQKEYHRLVNKVKAFRAENNTKMELDKWKLDIDVLNPPNFAKGDLGAPISMKEVYFMVWAGLRGAVGLALGLQFFKTDYTYINIKNSDVDNSNANVGSEAHKLGVFRLRGVAAQMLMHITFVAFFTLAICATTGEQLLKKLGLIGERAAEIELREDVEARIHKEAADNLQEAFHRVVHRIHRAIELRKEKIDDDEKYSSKSFRRRMSDGSGRKVGKPLHKINETMDKFQFGVVMEEAQAMIIGLGHEPIVPNPNEKVSCGSRIQRLFSCCDVRERSTTSKMLRPSKSDAAAAVEEVKKKHLLSHVENDQRNKARRCCGCTTHDLATFELKHMIRSKVSHQVHKHLFHFAWIQALKSPLWEMDDGKGKNRGIFERNDIDELVKKIRGQAHNKHMSETLGHQKKKELGVLKPSKSQKDRRSMAAQAKFFRQGSAQDSATYRDHTGDHEPLDGDYCEDDLHHFLTTVDKESDPQMSTKTIQKMKKYLIKTHFRHLGDAAVSAVKAKDGVGGDEESSSTHEDELDVPAKPFTVADLRTNTSVFGGAMKWEATKEVLTFTDDHGKEVQEPVVKVTYNDECEEDPLRTKTSTAIPANVLREKLKLMRTLFLGVVKAQYYTMIKNKELPPDDMIAELATHTCDVALDKVGELYDEQCGLTTELIDPNLDFVDWAEMDRVSKSTRKSWRVWKRVLLCLDHCLPNEARWDNRLLLKIDHLKHQKRFFLLMAYLQAHREGQKTIQATFGEKSKWKTIQKMALKKCFTETKNSEEMQEQVKEDLAMFDPDSIRKSLQAARQEGTEFSDGDIDSHNAAEDIAVKQVMKESINACNKARALVTDVYFRYVSEFRHTRP